jgi:hypothetical protein
MLAPLMIPMEQLNEAMDVLEQSILEVAAGK